MQSKSAPWTSEEAGQLLAAPALRASYVALTILLVLSWTYAIPGLVALQDGVLTSGGIRAKLRGSAEQLFIAYERGTKTPGQSSGKTEAPPLYLGPFNGHGDLWLYSYSALACLLLLLRPSFPGPLSSRQVLFWGTLGYIAFMWTNWLRNFVLNTPERGRVVYSYANWDMSRASFFLQEGRAWGMMTLVALVCIIWRRHGITVRERVHGLLVAPDDQSVLVLAEIYRELFKRWQLSSLVLALVFLPWTGYYWKEIKAQDYRYLPSAITLHICWAITWYCISTSFLQASEAWSHFKIVVLSKTAHQAAAPGQPANLLSVFEAAERPAEWQIVGAGVAAAVSFLLPVLNLLFK